MATDGPEDLLVIGGGIQGLATALVAAERGYRATLLERDTLGAGASASWFRILHGGLRYLQTLDLPRFRESVRERRWFLRAGLEGVEVRPFLMPLYGQGLKRSEVFRIAFAMDALAGLDRNAGVDAALRLNAGRVVSSDTVRAMFPQVRGDGLRGGALWNEAVVTDDRRFFMSFAAKVRDAGVTLVEGVRDLQLLTEGGAVAGLQGTVDGAAQHWRAPKVINATGAWGGAVARQLDPRFSRAWPGCIGFNLVLDREPLSTAGVSLLPPDVRGDMLFMQPLGGQTFAGTWYVPHSGDPEQIAPSEANIATALDMLNAAVPGAAFQRDAVVRVTTGVLPVETVGGTDLRNRGVIHAHDTTGGPEGLFSVWGVKYATARAQGGKVLDAAGLS
ncbi:MAG: FAD-dependent oxidoreductase [Pseudomonadota bacterium]